MEPPQRLDMQQWQQTPETFDSKQVRAYLHQPAHADEVAPIVRELLANIATHSDNPLYFETVKVLPAVDPGEKSERSDFIRMMARAGLLRTNPSQTISLLEGAIRDGDVAPPKPTTSLETSHCEIRSVSGGRRRGLAGPVPEGAPVRITHHPLSGLFSSAATPD